MSRSKYTITHLLCKLIRSINNEHARQSKANGYHQLHKTHCTPHFPSYKTHPTTPVITATAPPTHKLQSKSLTPLLAPDPASTPAVPVPNNAQPPAMPGHATALKLAHTLAALVAPKLTPVVRPATVVPPPGAEIVTPYPAPPCKSDVQTEYSAAQPE
jgi:hypothetical protein